ncbi:MAG: DNA helicase RecQ [Selenomonadaceae bacterium]|nr:DNA helicase RecQ [Selenomonadaceae bacterium]
MNLTNSKKLLKKYFGYDEFRPAQEKIIDSILNGNDTLAIMPTGAGKSICFQIPALILDGVAVVVSPLISLMKDQVDALNTAGIPATFINSALDKMERDNRVERLLKGAYKLLYIAPEALDTYTMNSVLPNLKISLIAIDEAHCVSQWGHDFRPHYQEIAPFIERLPYRPLVAAFTATATPKVQEDIVNLLRLQSPKVYISGFDRPNLYFKVLRNVDKDNFVLDYIKEHPGDSGIIYAATQKKVEQLHLFLLQHGIKAGRYHAGLSNQERIQTQDDFIYDRTDVIVATVAFGMGIDKSNVRFVIHYNMPKSIEGYYQEAGRAGRDGEKSDCILLFAQGDINTQKYLITHSEDTSRIAANMALLSQMIKYCHTPYCLRAFLLNYFGDMEAKDYCGFCENCEGNAELKDITVDTQMVLSCVYRMSERFGSSMVADVLKGSKAERIKTWGFDKLSTYGLMKERRVKDIREFIETLVAMGYLSVTESEYPTLSLNEKSWNMLRNKEQVFCKVKTEKRAKVDIKTANASNENADIFNKLRKLRLDISRRIGIPPFMVFSDATLRSIATTMPKTKEEFLQISGVGEKKLAVFGDEFLDFIRNNA